jgi:hypothetical protein
MIRTSFVISHSQFDSYDNAGRLAVAPPVAARVDGSGFPGDHDEGFDSGPTVK